MDVKVTKGSFNGALDKQHNRRDVRPKLTEKVRAARTRPHGFAPSEVHRFCDDCGLSPTYPIHATNWQVFKRPRRPKVAAS